MSRRDTRAVALVARMEVCAWRLRQGETVRGGDLRQIADEIGAIGPELGNDDRAWVAERVGWLRSGLELARDAVGRRLSELPAGRRAVRGYSVLRNEDIGARIRVGV